MWWLAERYLIHRYKGSQTEARMVINLIRFIDLGKQIALDPDDPEWRREFTFYDTITASFLRFDGQSVFDSLEDLIEQMDDCDAVYMKRITSLIPSWVPRGKPTLNR